MRTLHLRRLARILPGLLLLILAGACSDSDSPGVTEAEERPAINEPGSRWPHPNYDLHNSRATFESTIDASNVDRLEMGWCYELPHGGSGAAATTPIIIDGVVYLGDLASNVHAVDLATGKRRWMADVGEIIFGPGGAAVAGGRVFASSSSEAIVAYDASTGEQLWSTDLLMSGGAVDIQPVTAEGLVLAATSALQVPGGRGTLYALDQATGEIVWSFDTIVSSDLWGNPEINSGGGSWYPPAVDVDAGVVYWGTSNPYPFPGAEGFPNGSSRPGDNRWTDSILALDLRTGELRWGFQVVPHDLFDRDTVVTAIVERGAAEKVIINTGKVGRVLGFDPEGNLLWDTPVGMHENDDLEAIEGPTTVLPGTLGGVETPIAVADGVVYASVVNAPVTYGNPEETSSGYPVGIGTYESRLVAIDASNGEVRWDVPLPGDSFGAATVVNDLVFTSVFTGEILAFDRKTGEKVWSYSAPGGINGWPAFVDDKMVIPVGFGKPPCLLMMELGED